MLKKLHILLLTLLTALCCTVTAWADYDYINDYSVSVQPNTEDGSLNITVSLTWTALEELPYNQELKIGVPNGSIREETALTDNIERLSFDNSYMYVYLDRAYEQGETFTFSYSWVQEYMYGLDGDTVTYDYTPGWFDEAKIGAMTLLWIDPAGLTGDFSDTSTADGDVTRQDGVLAMTASGLDYGQTMTVRVRYTDWPTALSADNSADYAPDDGWYDDGYYDDGTDIEGVIGGIVILFIVICIVVVLCSRGDGYAGGFGTRYVFVNHLWYPAGPDGKPRPGSVGTKTRPARPAAAASAAAAAAVDLAAAASAAAGTAPAPAAVPVPAPAPVPAAAARAARPKISTARCGWTRRLPRNWIPETGGTAPCRLSFSQKRSRPASRAAQAGGILESFLYYSNASPSPCK